MNKQDKNIFKSVFLRFGIVRKVVVFYKRK